MQIREIMLLLIMLIIIPTAILTSNHDVFFIIVALVIFIASIRKAYFSAFNIEQNTEGTSDETVEDLEEMLNLNMKRFGTGTVVVKNLIIILFFLYCSFFTHVLWEKALITAVILYWIHGTVNCLIAIDGDASSHARITNKVVDIFINLVTVLIISIVAYIKFSSL
jgi:hypothetical protein